MPLQQSAGVGKGFSAAADLTDQVAGMTATGYGGLARVLGFLLSIGASTGPPSCPIA